MLNRRSMCTALGAIILGLAMAASTAAWGTGNETTYLTFSGPFALPGVSLPAGTYVFEVADPVVTREIVRVLSRDLTHLYVSAFTRTVPRPYGMRADRQVTFAEVPRGTAPRVTTWFPIGESVGHQFVYPAKSRQYPGRASN